MAFGFSGWALAQKGTLQNLIKIRLAKEKDLARILEIENFSFSSPWSASKFSLGKILLAYDEKGIWAFLVVEEVLEEVNILHIAVDPHYRRQGLAQLLVKEALKNASYAILEVRASNEPAISLYKKLNFKEISRRSKYYQDNDEDALVMSWQKTAPSN